MDIPLSSMEQVCELFIGRAILFIGDSITRGMYKDVAYLLSGYDCLLSQNELKHNRHKKEIALFGDTTDKFFINRTNRTLKSTQFGHHLSYIFTSRIFNREMIKILACIKNDDIILIGSQTWDLTRYQDYDCSVHIKNMDNLFEKLKLTEKLVI